MVTYFFLLFPIFRRLSTSPFRSNKILSTYCSFLNNLYCMQFREFESARSSLYGTPTHGFSGRNGPNPMINFVLSTHIFLNLIVGSIFQWVKDLFKCRKLKHIFWVYRLGSWNQTENKLTKNYFVKFWRIGYVLCNSYISRWKG